MHLRTGNAQPQPAKRSMIARPDRLDRRLSVAPMMAWTDRHCRYFLRLISRRALLYTEMVHAGAILHGPRERLLRFDPAEHPVALQLGGADPAALAEAAKWGERFGYDEINLNLGCPSDRVQRGRFGACLMAEPALVARCIEAMQSAVEVPVTVKTRIGIDDQDSYDFLCGFVETVADTGCRTFIVHARKAWLRGLSPKANRELPPLRYDVVQRLKADFPDLEIVLNGGIRTVEGALEPLARLDGVMLGREVYHNPYALLAFERALFDRAGPEPARDEIIERLLPYVERELAAGTPLKAISRHILGLFNGVPGARTWRRHLSEAAHREGAGRDVLLDALRRVSAGNRPPSAGRIPEPITT